MSTYLLQRPLRAADEQQRFVAVPVGTVSTLVESSGW